MAKRHFLRTGAITAAVVLLLATSAAASSLSGSVRAGATFPARTLVLTVPPGVRAGAPRIYVTENGKPVGHLSVTPEKRTVNHNFGVALVIDRSGSMSGVPLAQAMAAARAIAAKRTRTEKLGVITFDRTSTVLLPMTSDARTINRALATTPPIGTGTRILPALMAGLKQLAAAHDAGGAVILISDGATAVAGGLTPASVSAAAQRQQVRIFTVGLRDSSFTPVLMRRLAQLGGGKFVVATGAQLPRVFTHITSALTQSYALSYRSILPAGQRVAVTVHVDGVPKSLSLSYYAPVPPRPSTPTTTTTPRAAVKSPKTSAPTAASTFFGLTSAPAGAQGRLTARTSPAAQPGPSPAASSAQSGTAWKALPPHRSFWSSSLGILVIAAGCVLLIALAIALMVFGRPSRQTLQRRVGTFTLASSEADATASALGGEGTGRLARLLTSRRGWPTFVEQVDAARMKRSPLAIVKRWAVASAVGAFLLAYVTGSAVLGILLLAAAPFVLRAVVSRGARRQRNQFNQQLPSHLQDLAGAMRGGRSFIGALAAVASSSNEPIRGELERALSDESLGLPLEETLEAISRRMNAKDMEQVALIAALQRKSGSNVSEALERVADSSSERADLQREMRALTGQARMSAWVLSGLPPAMLAGLTVLAPSYSHPLFHTVPGVVLLVIGAGMVVSGWLVMNRIVNPEA